MKKSLLATAILASTCFFSNALYAADINFISYDGDILAKNKAELTDSNPALKKLVSLANKALKVEIDPVTNKTLVSASGDKHDYFSFGPYWWPNPDTKDGLPYIRRDGEYNMDTKTAATDKMRMIRFAKDVENLGLAYYFTDNKAYAEKAKQQLDAWFVNPKTRMNPNMDHAQAIPGRVDGRGIGIIDSRLLIGVMDSVEMIRPTMTDKEYNAVVKWYADFRDWLVTSRNGFEEDNWHNNHGSWYDAQVVAFSLFTHDMDLAKKRLEITQMRRIGGQFDIEGKQGAELERTKPWHYSNFNLEAYNLLGRYGELAKVDVWNYSIDKHSLQNGYNFVAKNVVNTDTWDYKGLKERDVNIAYENMLNAKRAYKDPIFDKAVEKLESANKSDIENLLYK
ncbi:alginate lyase family protein [Vibrio rumoiensis]|uniref:alginate lyase family protein n=1 Tax=Vibrio rumoiensis TaxID=76258 RepID=UPI000B5C9D28|nr:alginate lyase family protein [Vibrio rumoiensis]